MSNERKTVELAIPASLLRQSGPAMVIEGEHALRVVIPVAGQGLGTCCIWEDCDQEPIYCEGHAREYVAGLTAPAEVGKAEATLLRTLRETVKVAQAYFATANDPNHDQLSRVGALANLLGQLHVADAVARRFR